MVLETTLYSITLVYLIIASYSDIKTREVPDFLNAKIGGRLATEVISDRAWLEEKFINDLR